MICVSAAGCAVPSPPSPESPLLAYCTKLYVLWFRYAQHPTFHHTGERARAEFAHYRCQKGNYEPGIRELKFLVERNRLDVPPPPKE
jgi:hypothetical protein